MLASHCDVWYHELRATGPMWRWYPAYRLLCPKGLLKLKFFPLPILFPKQSRIPKNIIVMNPQKIKQEKALPYFPDVMFSTVPAWCRISFKNDCFP